MRIFIFVSSITALAAGKSSCLRTGTESWRCGPGMSDPALIALNFTQTQDHGQNDEGLLSLAWGLKAQDRARDLYSRIVAIIDQDRETFKSSHHTNISDLSPILHTDEQTAEKTPLDPSILQRTLNSIQRTIELYSPSNVVLSFNGGKDATVLLNIYLAVLVNEYDKLHVPAEKRYRPHADFYIDPSTPESLLEFVLREVDAFDLAMRVYEGSYRENLAQSVSDRQDIKDGTHLAYLIGVRYDDNHSTERFQPSDPWLAPIMRVHPLLDWNYGSIWSFLSRFSIPYCPLYDLGYTSLNKLNGDYRNERLRISDDTYLPAKALKKIDWKSERHEEL